MKKKSKVLFLLVAIFFFTHTFVFFGTSVSGFWDGLSRNENHVVQLGSFVFGTGIQTFDPNNNYQIGDQFFYDGNIWEVRASGDTSLPPSQVVLQPFGVFQEITSEFRDFNTYFEGDTVLFEGVEFVALFNGMSGQTPGTVQGWQALTDEWMPFNVYAEGDIVIFNGIEFEALWNNVSGEPGTTNGWQALNTDEWQPFNVYLSGDEVTFEGGRFRSSWWNQNTPPSGNNVGVNRVWVQIEGSIEPSQTTHGFNGEILEGTLVINGNTVVENGVIDQTLASQLGLSITKGTQWGNFFWEISEGGLTLRLTPNNTIVYLGNGQLSFQSFEIIID